MKRSQAVYLLIDKLDYIWRDPRRLGRPWVESAEEVLAFVEKVIGMEPPNHEWDPEIILEESEKTKLTLDHIHEAWENCR